MNDSVEVWRVIDNYPQYEVSNHGCVRSWSYKKRGKLLRQQPNRNGYLQVKLFNDTKKRTWFVHLLVLEAFHGKAPEGMECRHLDGNPGNNHISNLVWGTKQENWLDKRRHGTEPKQRGSEVATSKITEAEVVTIRRMAGNGNSYAAIGRKFDMTGENISMIVNRKTWAHVL